MNRHIFINFIVAIFLLIGASSQAQNSLEADERLLASFTKHKLTEMSTAELGYWSFYVNQGFLLFEINKGKEDSEMGFLEYVGSLEDLNPLALGLKPLDTTVQTIRLGSTGHGIMIFSEKKIKAKMERLK